MARWPCSEGELAAGEVAGLFRNLFTRLASGCLDLETEDGTRRFWLEAGQVQALETSVEEEKLGQWLVNRGLLQREQLALMLLRQSDGELFGDLLLQENVLSAEALHEELVARAAASLAKLLFVPVAYRFQAQESLDPRKCVMEVTTGDLLLAAARLVPVEQLRTYLPPRSFVSLQEEALLREQRVYLSPAEGFLLSRVDGRRTWEQLKHLVPLPEEQYLRALVGLVMAGILQLADEPAATPPRLLLSQQEPESPQPEGDVFTPHEAAEHERVLNMARDIERRNYYQRLGLSPGASQDQIHERFRELARLYHPDRASEPHLRTLRAELARIYTALQDAHETLSHPERRARYDSFLQQSGQAGDFAEEERRRQAQLEIARANRLQAELLIKAGDYGGALPLLEQAVRYDPQPETLLALARVELRNPMWGHRALSHLRLAVTMDPQLTPAWLELAHFWLRRRHLERARACVDKVLEYEPASAEALALRRQLK